MVARKHVAIVSGVLFLLFAGFIAFKMPQSLAAVQKSFVLDLDAPAFVFEERQFDDSSYSKEYTYPSGGNVTYWVRLPKNSTVLNATMSLTGKIVPIYNVSVNSAGGILGISIGDVTGNSENEIVMGTENQENNVLIVLNGSNGSLIWNMSIGGGSIYKIYSTAIGNITTNPGNEIAVASADGRVYVINTEDSGGTEEWNFSTTGEARAVAIGDLESDGLNEVVVGSDGGYVFTLNYNGSQRWNYSVTGAVNDVSIANISSDSGNEVIFVASQNIYVINSSGSLVWSKNLGVDIKAIAINNVTSDPGNEIAVGTSTDGRVYLLNSTGYQIWNYTAGGPVNSVVIEDVTSDPGNEIIAGSTQDKKIHTISSQGSLIWEYAADSHVKSVKAGNLTTDEGNEVAAGSTNGYLYVFNFDYFPDNVSIDVDGGGYDWNYYGKLRTTIQAGGTSQFVTALNNALNSCQPDSSGVCNISLLFHSDWAGKLNISGLNITYSYNISSIISAPVANSVWSRTRNINANESVGYQVRNITFLSNPSNSITVNYIRISQSATACDFNGSSYSVTTAEGQVVCNVPDFTIPSSGALPGPFSLWDNTMSTGIPVIMEEQQEYYTYITDDFSWKKNLTIWNNTNTLIYNVSANITLNETAVKGNESLNVIWKGQACDLTPSSGTSTCNTANPVYTAKPCLGDIFYVCKQDTNSNGVYDFFRWVQPHSNSSVSYVVSGSINLPPNLSSQNVTPQQSVFGSWFNFSVYVNDTEGDSTSVALWINKSLSGWERISDQNISGEGEIWFNLTSDSSWVGQVYYKFEYQDFNSSGYPVHSKQNTSVFSGPLVLKHNVSVELIKGNNTEVNRSESTLLIVRINDTETGNWSDINGTRCIFWITRDGSSFTSFQNLSNSSGYCQYLFTPDGNYSAGNQTWKGGVWNDTYYSDANSTDFVIAIKGKINITLISPTFNQSLLRNSTNHFIGRMVDEYGTPVQVSGYNCTFWFLNQSGENQIGINQTNSTGFCSLEWDPNCSVSLGQSTVNITLSGNASYFYWIEEDEDNIQIVMKDILEGLITSPMPYSYHHKGDNIALNSTANDSCKLCSEGDYSSEWSIKFKQRLMVSLNETNGFSRQNETIIISGSELEEEGIDLSDWRIAYTKVILNGQEVPSEVKAWTNSSKTEINTTQVFLNNYSELVFLANLSALQNLTYWIYYNESNPTDWNISFIRNSGFEAGLSNWQCVNGSNCDQYNLCECSVVQEGSESAGNHSLKILVNPNTQLNNVNVTVSQNLGTQIQSNYLKIRYKPLMQSSGGSYIKVSAGSDSCNLTLQPAVWTETLCNGTFNTSYSISISVFDGTQDGANSSVYIDYICIADSSGNCISMDSGSPPVKTLNSQDYIGSGNLSWQVPLNETLGKRTIVVNSSGQYYTQNLTTVHIYIFGWSNISLMNLSSDDCIYNQTYECMSNATIDFFCLAMDNQSGQGIHNYNVSFFINGSYLGSNMTNSSGFSVFRWLNSTNQIGTYNISCNISDTIYEPTTYYNITSENGAFVVLDIVSGNTTANISLSPLSETAVNITREHNHSFYLNVTILNTGNGTMYSPSINISAPLGIFVQPMSCPSLASNSSCLSSLQVNVTQSAEPSSHNVNITVFWSNADSTQGNSTNSTTISVENNTALNITQTQLNITIARGDSRTAGNFTVESYGNTPLSNVTFFLSGGNSSTISGWVSFTPENISYLEKAQSQVVLINLTVPSNQTEGIYTATLTANATSSFCSPDSECWDSVSLVVNVTQPDWDRSPANLSKTIGLSGENGTIGVITVTNNQNQNYTFSVNVTGIGSTYVKTDKQSFILSALSTSHIYVYHNTTGSYSPGYWFANVTITNLNGSFPASLNTSVNLNVINLTVQIISPNQTNPTSPVNSSDRINITVNATLSGQPVSSDIIWTVLVGGEVCGDLQSSYNPSTEFWEINCTAPNITGNIILNKLRVTGNYTGMQGAVVSDEEEDAVIYQDITPPQISNISVDPVNYYSNTPYIIITANITDNSVVNSSWAVITLPNGTNSTAWMQSNTSSVYTFNFTNPNLTGDYDVYIFANDSSGYSNFSLGWFDVYKPFTISGTLSSPVGQNQTANFTFYRNGTSTIIHTFSTNSSQGSYNWPVHDRVYDVRISAFGHTVTLYGVNTTASAINQHNYSATNVTNVFRLDDFPNRTSPDISNFDLPNTAQKIILGFVIETPNLSYSTSEITIDYTTALAAAVQQITIEESNLRIFRCTDWNFQSRVCSSGEFSHFNESLLPNTSANTFTFNSAPSTAYAVAESCYPNICGQSQQQTPGSGTTGGTTGGGGTTQPVCGNGKCETGENSQNCPQDCPPEEFPFTVKTGVTNIRLRPGDKATYPFSITNMLNKTIKAEISLSGLDNYLKLEKGSVDIPAKGTETFNIYVSVPSTAEPGTYTGTITVSAEGKTKEIPVTMVVSLEGRSQLSLIVKILTKKVEPENDLKYTVMLTNIGFGENITLKMTYTVRNAVTEEIVREESETLNLSLATGDSHIINKIMKITENNPPVGQYYLEVVAEFDHRSVSDTDTFEVTQVFWATPFGQFVSWFIIIGAIVFIAYYERRRYVRWRMKKSRYLFPTNYAKIPQETDEAFWIGKIADTDRKAWFNPNDLTTHVLIAGSTGSGKSVSASVFVEEALDKKIPVIVFDPTAQWTGFVKQCEDPNLLRYYRQFGMDERYAKPYKGMIFEITDPHITIDFKKYMIPGEITVFTMNKLGPGEYDVAVRNIINAIFRTGWEESTTLKMIMVFDEVHRLLEKYGGVGGYISLEQACREFRKWGIGIIMCSQVLADFKEAIAGNVLTDIQMNTKSLVDIRKVETKYGPEYATRISRQGVGVGMVQHPKYNDGKPYFVQFRPTWHNPHKITDEELQLYKEFAERLEAIERKIEELKKRKDVTDIEIELKLAKDKLKQGRFRMAKIYITSLEEHLGIKGK